jgi:DNA-binding transcriptional regulator YiaG
VLELVEEARVARRLPPPSARRAIREAAGVTQQRIAVELGVTRAAVSFWEQGRCDPRGDRRLRYVAILEGLQRDLMTP